MEHNLEDLVSEIHEIQCNEPKLNIKWACPICSGSRLTKGKVTQTKSYDMDVEVTTSLGELEITVAEGDAILEHIKYPIRYCPWCGRKIRQVYRKNKSKR